MENYILHITAGKGPAECCMAVALALKEVLQDAKEQGLQIDIVERIQGSENRTLLSATLIISGSNAKSFCNSWTGVLLWTCKSPFRKFHKRKNWFIGIHHFDKSSFSKWNENDISFETMRSGGPGGQHVNKVESAVRARHNPSGISVMVNESRSQLQNKKTAIERLKIRYDEWLLKQATEQQQDIWQQHKTLERGNPIRVYEGLNFRRVENQPEKNRE